MVAIDVMGTTPTAIFFVVACLLFVIAAVVNRKELGWLIPAGLACWMFVLAWNAVAAT